MIAHLRGREDALDAFGWQGRQAKSIAPACLVAQLTSYLQIDRWLPLRFVCVLLEPGLAAGGHTGAPEGLPRGIYRALVPSTFPTHLPDVRNCSCGASSRMTPCLSTRAWRGSRPNWTRSA